MPEDLYLHFPFCSGRCAYCAFVSGPPPADPLQIVTDLLREAEARQVTLAPLKTLYCGGGTPALLGEAGFRALATSGLFTFAKGGYEWTVELHPAAVTESLVATLAELGVTRLSIGVQSFNDATLVRCNRRHTAAQALQAIAWARAAIQDTGIDLIAGLPGVTLEEWQRTLAQTVALDLPHVSVYALSIDAGSTWAREGRAAPDPDEVCDAVAQAAETLQAQGLERYETSNYARPGFACRHNLNTWHGGDYLGLGRGAASRLGLLRRDGFGVEERLSEEEDALERALTSLRLSTGFHPEDFPKLKAWHAHWERCLATFRAHGLLDNKNAPTTRGYEVLDAMTRELLDRTV